MEDTVEGPSPGERGWERALVLWVKNSLESMSRNPGESQQYFA